MVLRVQINEFECCFVFTESNFFDPDDLAFDDGDAFGVLDIDIEDRADLGLTPTFTGDAHP